MLSTGPLNSCDKEACTMRYDNSKLHAIFGDGWGVYDRERLRCALGGLEGTIKSLIK